MTNQVCRCMGSCVQMPANQGQLRLDLRNVTALRPHIRPPSFVPTSTTQIACRSGAVHHRIRNHCAVRLLEVCNLSTFGFAAPDHPSRGEELTVHHISSCRRHQPARHNNFCRHAAHRSRGSRGARDRLGSRNVHRPSATAQQPSEVTKRFSEQVVRSYGSASTPARESGRRRSGVGGRGTRCRRAGFTAPPSLSALPRENHAWRQHRDPPYPRPGRGCSILSGPRRPLPHFSPPTCVTPHNCAYLAGIRSVTRTSSRGRMSVEAL
jgi:hypothetical protein